MNPETNLDGMAGPGALHLGKPEVREFLSDIITTAVEGGTGYWAEVDRYVHGTPGETYAELVELEDEEQRRGTTHVVSIQTIAKGIAVMRGGALGPSWAGDAHRWSLALDAGDIDAEAADVIVQAALFGEVRYG